MNAELRMQELEEQLATLRNTNAELKTQIDEAFGVIAFYSNPKNYSLKNNFEQLPTTYQNVLNSDFSEADNDPKVKVAGHRARQYLKKWVS